MMRRKRLTVIELSALRQSELMPLVESLDTLDLSGFQYISIHGPSRFDPQWEATLCERLAVPRRCGWPIVIHPDVIHDFTLWRQLGCAICIENMDKRKAIGRSVRELAIIFENLPEATLCPSVLRYRPRPPV